MNNNPATAVVETSGPLVLQFDAIGNLTLLKREGNEIVGIDPTTLLTDVILPPEVGTTTKVRMWSQANALATGTNAFGLNVILFALHFEERGYTYDAAVTQLTGTTGTSAYRIAMWSHSTVDGQPDQLLWLGNEINAAAVGGVTGQKVQTFASDGAWQTGSDDYQNGSDQLVLDRTQSVWFSYMAPGGHSVRSVAQGGLRSWGLDTTGTGPITGLQAARTYTLGYPADTSGLSITDYNNQMPFIGLRRI